MAVEPPTGPLFPNEPSERSGSPLNSDPSSSGPLPKDQPSADIPETTPEMADIHRSGIVEESLDRNLLIAPLADSIEQAESDPASPAAFLFDELPAIAHEPRQEGIPFEQIVDNEDATVAISSLEPVTESERDLFSAIGDWISDSSTSLGLEGLSADPAAGTESGFGRAGSHDHSDESLERLAEELLLSDEDFGDVVNSATSPTGDDDAFDIGSVGPFGPDSSVTRRDDFSDGSSVDLGGRPAGSSIVSGDRPPTSSQVLDSPSGSSMSVPGSGWYDAPPEVMDGLGLPLPPTPAGSNDEVLPLETTQHNFAVKLDDIFEEPQEVTALPASGWDDDQPTTHVGHSSILSDLEHKGDPQSSQRTGPELIGRHSGDSDIIGGTAPPRIHDGPSGVNLLDPGNTQFDPLLLSSQSSIFGNEAAEDISLIDLEVPSTPAVAPESSVAKSAELVEDFGEFHHHLGEDVRPVSESVEWEAPGEEEPTLELIEARPGISDEDRAFEAISDEPDLEVNDEQYSGPLLAEPTLDVEEFGALADADVPDLALEEPDSASVSDPRDAGSATGEWEAPESWTDKGIEPDFDMEHASFTGEWHPGDPDNACVASEEAPSGEDELPQTAENMAAPDHDDDENADALAAALLDFEEPESDHQAETKLRLVLPEDGWDAVAAGHVSLEDQGSPDDVAMPETTLHLPSQDWNDDVGVLGFSEDADSQMKETISVPVSDQWDDPAVFPIRQDDRGDARLPSASVEWHIEPAADEITAESYADDHSAYSMESEAESTSAADAWAEDAAREAGTEHVAPGDVWSQDTEYYEEPVGDASASEFESEADFAAPLRPAPSSLRDPGPSVAANVTRSLATTGEDALLSAEVSHSRRGDRKRTTGEEKISPKAKGRSSAWIGGTLLGLLLGVGGVAGLYYAQLLPPAEPMSQAPVAPPAPSGDIDRLTAETANANQAAAKAKFDLEAQTKAANAQAAQLGLVAKELTQKESDLKSAKAGLITLEEKLKAAESLAKEMTAAAADAKKLARDRSEELAEKEAKLADLQKKVVASADALGLVLREFKAGRLIDEKAEGPAAFALLPGALRTVLDAANSADARKAMDAIAAAKKQIVTLSAELKAAEEMSAKAAEEAKKALLAATKAKDETDEKAKKAAELARNESVKESEKQLAALQKKLNETSAELKAVTAEAAMIAKKSQDEAALKLAEAERARAAETKKLIEQHAVQIEQLTTQMAEVRTGVKVPLATPEVVALDRALAAYASGLDAYHARRYEDAERSFANAIRDNPGDARYWYFHGLSALELGKSAEAGASFKKGGDLEARYKPSSREIGAALERIQGNARKALAPYRP